MKTLAIKGDKERGNEVIALLKMLGGKNVCNLDGKHAILWISNRNNYICNKLLELEHTPNFEIFTLDEFYEKYPHKVGDVIKFPNNMTEEIAEMRWDEELEDIIYTSVSGLTRPCYVPKNTKNKTNMKTDCKKCGLHFGSVQCFDKDCPHNTPKSYAVSLVGDKVIDNLTHKDINMNACKSSEKEWTKQVAYLTISEGEFADEVELNLDGYEIEVRDGKTYAVKKKPVYPATYVECCEVIANSKPYAMNEDYTDVNKLLQTLQTILICRNAYWKIAGEQMGFDKPWEPDWENGSPIKYTIIIYNNIIKKAYNHNENCILAFPSAEMQDAFYENFKDLIEKCKELL